MKTNTISAKQANNAAKALSSKAHTLSQAIKVLKGIYNDKLENTDGLTVEAYLEAMGVMRPTKTNAKGEEYKTDYAPKSIYDAWAESMKSVGEDGKTTCKVYRAVPAKYAKEGENGKKTYFRVYASAEEAAKLDGTPISRYQLVDIAADGWDIDVILRGLKQVKRADKLAKKANESAKAWEELPDTLYYAYEVVNADKTITREVKEIAKILVEF